MSRLGLRNTDEKGREFWARIEAVAEDVPAWVKPYITEHATKVRQKMASLSTERMPIRVTRRPVVGQTALEQRVAELEAALQRVRELHANVPAFSLDRDGPPLSDLRYCEACGVIYPCTTLQALEGA